MKVLAGKCRRGIQDSYMKYESMADPDSCVLFQQRIKGREYGLDVMNGLDGRYRTTIVKGAPKCATLRWRFVVGK